MSRVLYVRVGELRAGFMARARKHARRIDSGKVVEPMYEIGFDRAEEMLSVLTAKRWALIETLRASGPLTVAELARRTGRIQECPWRLRATHGVVDCREGRSRKGARGVLGDRDRYETARAGGGVIRTAGTAGVGADTPSIGK